MKFTLFYNLQIKVSEAEQMSVPTTSALHINHVNYLFIWTLTTAELHIRKQLISINSNSKIMLICHAQFLLFPKEIDQISAFLTFPVCIQSSQLSKQCLSSHINTFKIKQ